MESEDSLPQVPVTCPYFEPARSNPYFHIPLPEDLIINHVIYVYYICVHKELFVNQQLKIWQYLEVMLNKYDAYCMCSSCKFSTETKHNKNNNSHHHYKFTRNLLNMQVNFVISGLNSPYNLGQTKFRTHLTCLHNI
jgi:hypothetical protein